MQRHALLQLRRRKSCICLQARQHRVDIQSWHGTHGLVVLVVTTFSYTYSRIDMGPAGFEPATSSARGWHPAKLDNGPRIARCLDAIRIICLLITRLTVLGCLAFRSLKKPCYQIFSTTARLSFAFCILVWINTYYTNHTLAFQEPVQIKVEKYAAQCR